MTPARRGRLDAEDRLVERRFRHDAERDAARAGQDLRQRRSPGLGAFPLGDVDEAVALIADARIAMQLRAAEAIGVREPFSDRLETLGEGVRFLGRHGEEVDQGQAHARRLPGRPGRLMQPSCAAPLS